MFTKSLLVIGGIALDITATVGKSSASILHTSTPGHVKQSLGGVGRNVAEAAWRTGGNNVKLVSVVGDDLAGQSVRQGMEAIGMNTEYIQVLKGKPTAVYNALHSNDGHLVAAVADMNIFESMEPSKIIHILKSEKPGFVCFDGNITSQTMKAIATTCESLSVPVFFEPTSVLKSLKLFEYIETTQARSVQYTSPNQYELEAMCDAIQSHPVLASKAKMNSSLPEIQLKHVPRLAKSVLANAIFLSKYIPNVFTKLGEEGCLYVDNKSVVEYFPPEVIEASEIKSVTGAGDCFVGTLVMNLQQNVSEKGITTNKLRKIISKSQQSSIRALKSDNAVSVDIKNDLLIQ